MSGFSAKLPLQYDSIDGAYALNKDLKSVIKQNFKMLLLTNPGERIMDVDYGIGVKTLLFEQRTSQQIAIIKGQILRKTNKYLPFIQINSIDMLTAEEISDLDENSIAVSIDYSIPNINAEDQISLILTGD